MPRRKTPSSDYKRMYDWQKANMKAIVCKYKSDFVADFKAACKSLKTSQSDVIRKAMQQTINRAKGK